MGLLIAGFDDDVKIIHPTALFYARTNLCQIRRFRSYQSTCLHGQNKWFGTVQFCNSNCQHTDVNEELHSSGSVVRIRLTTISCGGRGSVAKELGEKTFTRGRDKNQFNTESHSSTRHATSLGLMYLIGQCTCTVPRCRCTLTRRRCTLKPSANAFQNQNKMYL